MGGAAAATSHPNPHVAPLTPKSARKHEEAIKKMSSDCNRSDNSQSSMSDVRKSVATLPSMDPDYLDKLQRKSIGNQLMAEAKMNAKEVSPGSTPRIHIEEEDEKHLQQMRNLRRKSTQLMNLYDQKHMAGVGGQHPNGALPTINPGSHGNSTTLVVGDDDTDAMVAVIKSKINLIKEIDRQKS
eukprot:PhF_6_TR41681/c0_g1_i1/m.63217